MDVMIQGRNVKITETLEDYAKKKVSKLDRYLPNILDIRVDLSSVHTRRGHDLIAAQITVRHKRGAILRAEDKTSTDINMAIDSVVDKIYHQIQRFKGKRIRKGRERFLATVEELDLAEEIPDIDEYVDTYSLDTEELTDEPVVPPDPIDRRKIVELSPMSEMEAIEQMELLGHTFFVFHNSEDGTVNVLYRRENGGYGLLVPNLP